MNEQGSTERSAEPHVEFGVPSELPPEQSRQEIEVAPASVEAVSAAPGPNDATVITTRPPDLGAAIIRPTQPHELGKLLAGERLNHFELIEFVGGGGMGAVFRARDTMLNREVALKVLSRDQGADDDMRRRFQNEAQSAARLDHENIARVHYVGEDRGLNYIVFEFIEGSNLRELVERNGGPLPLADAINYTLQIARALEHAASRDVVHRDIKPSNVLITAEGRAKLVDMGLARLHQVDAGGADLTASGVTLGTFDYISPEQARDPRSADVRSDLYSLGCTLYFMLSGQPPFPEGTVLQKLLQHNNEEPPDPRLLNPDCPEELSAVVRKLLAKSPRRRYQTPAELTQDLLALADRAGMTTVSWPGSSPLSTEPRAPTLVERHAPWFVPLAGLIAIAVVVELVSGPTGSSQASTGETSPPTLAVPAETPATTAPAEATRPPVPPATTVAPPMPETTTAPAVAPPTEVTTSGDATPPGVRVVAAVARGPRQYNSLRAACSNAEDGDVIELAYNGPREERPIGLDNKRLSIRAGEGFQPVVVFRPDDDDPVRYPRSMFNLTGGRLTLTGVAIDLQLPSPGDVPAEGWSVFEVQRAESIELQSCSLTVRNGAGNGATFQPGVSFFSLRSSPGVDSMMMAEESRAAPAFELRLENCVARGEATFLSVSDPRAFKFAWTNGLLATTEPFLVAGGAAPGREDEVSLALRHVTAAVGNAFCQFNGQLDGPHLLKTSVTLADCIVIGAPGAVLVEQSAYESVDLLQAALGWSGERNHYAGFDTGTAWRMVDLNQPDRPRRLTAAEWSTTGEADHDRDASWNRVRWRAPPSAELPAHRQTPADYVLDEQAEDNRAIKSAADGKNAGCEATLLPPLPADLATARR